MRNRRAIDAIDARILIFLARHPRATNVALAEALGLARNTVQTRLTRLEERGALGNFERRVDPAALGYPLSAYVTAQVTQSRLASVAERLAEIPEVLHVEGLSGPIDLLIHVVAVDAEDLYRVAGSILAIPGVSRTTTALVMRELVDYRVRPLMERLATTRG